MVSTWSVREPRRKNRYSKISIFFNSNDKISRQVSTSPTVGSERSFNFSLHEPGSILLETDPGRAWASDLSYSSVGGNLSQNSFSTINNTHNSDNTNLDIFTDVESENFNNSEGVDNYNSEITSGGAPIPVLVNVRKFHPPKMKRTPVLTSPSIRTQAECTGARPDIALFNCRSLLPKLPGLLQIFETLSPGVVALTETWTSQKNLGEKKWTLNNLNI